MLDKLSIAAKSICDWASSKAEVITAAWNALRNTAGNLWQAANTWLHQAPPYLEEVWNHVHEWVGYAEWGVAILAVIVAIYLVRKHGISGLKHKFFMWIERVAHLLHAVHVGSPASIVVAIIMMRGTAFGVPHDHGAPPPPPPPPPASDVNWPF